MTSRRTRRNEVVRGAFQTGDDGRYELRTVRPVDYTIPDDGPVGAMLLATWRPGGARGDPPTSIFWSGPPDSGRS